MQKYSLYKFILPFCGVGDFVSVAMPPGCQPFRFRKCKEKIVRECCLDKIAGMTALCHYRSRRSPSGTIWIFCMVFADKSNHSPFHVFTGIWQRWKIYFRYNDRKQSNDNHGLWFRSIVILLYCGLREMNVNYEWFTMLQANDEILFRRQCNYYFRGWRYSIMVNITYLIIKLKMMRFNEFSTYFFF